MTLYVDSSAFARRYLDEPGRDTVIATMADDTTWLTARHTLVEVHRTLHRVLDRANAGHARTSFDGEWQRTNIVELDAATVALATELAIETGARTLDALHLAAAYRAGLGTINLLTADIRQARAAEQVGFTVIVA